MKTAALLVCVLVLGCRSEPVSRAEPEAPAAAAVVEVPPADPCLLSSIEVRAEGGGARIPEERVRVLLEQGLRARSVHRSDGPGGALRVAYLLASLENAAGWSLGVKALWEVMDGPLRRPVSVDITRDLPADADVEAAAGEAIESLAAALTFRCRLDTVPAEILPALRGDLSAADDLVAWARACGDRRVEACGEGLREILNDERGPVAAAAALALGQAGISDAVPAIVARTVRADPLVVRAAALALGELGTEEAHRYLRLWSEGHPDPEVRGLAGEMIRAIASKAEGSSE